MNNPIALTNAPRFHYFDWDKAKTFYYIAQAGSFTKASDVLHISQPALSRQIQSLERSLDCFLFCRNARGLTLTRKGEELQKIIETTFQQLKEFVYATRPNEREQPRRIRIGIYKNMSFLFVRALQAYQEAHSYLTFEIVDENIHKDLLSLDLDIAFLPFEKNDAHIQKPLFTFERHLQFGDNLVIGTSKEFVSLFFVTPTLLKDDPEIEDIYHALCSGLEDGKKAETTQREAV